MALRDINLIPPQNLEKRRMKRHLLLWSGCLLGALGLICCIYLLQAYTIHIQKQRLNLTADIPLKLHGALEEMKRLQANQEKLGQQKMVMGAILKKSQSYSLVLHRLADIMNENTWLSQLTIDGSNDKESEIRLILNGSSTSNVYLGDFLNRLSTDTLFRAVILKFANEGGGEQAWPVRAVRPAKLINFQIECSLQKG
ncbi:MAG: PilN domain-containing protein [Deltaproteobacteria bacterium]|nr:PilN domain-containing protein [Deltaproteobacteria bacterium]